jgi:hypothetical protein
MNILYLGEALDKAFLVLPEENNGEGGGASRMPIELHVRRAAGQASRWKNRGWRWNSLTNQGFRQARAAKWPLSSPCRVGRVEARTGHFKLCGLQMQTTRQPKNQYP